MDTIKLEQIIREKYGNTGSIIVQKNGVSVYEYYENECTLNKGKWNGQQIVSSEWIYESTEEKSNWNDLKYGLLWWIIDKEEHSFAALGDGGNVIYINPKENMVIIIASYFKPRVKDRMKLIKEYIEPMWKEYKDSY